ncbi:MAG: hypothetical protein ACI9H8_001011 [Lysobacterales bacterium]|jgi:hypothetical protein
MRRQVVFTFFSILFMSLSMPLFAQANADPEKARFAVNAWRKSSNFHTFGPVIGL